MTNLSWFVVAFLAGAVSCTAPLFVADYRRHRRTVGAGRLCPKRCVWCERGNYWTPWGDS